MANGKVKTYFKKLKEMMEENKQKTRPTGSGTGKGINVKTPGKGQSGVGVTKQGEKPKNEIKFMSHPCGSYNNDTLEILKELGIELGFKQIMSIEPEKGMKKINNSFLEIARQDHADIFKRMN
jgi:hypothetical protein